MEKQYLVLIAGFWHPSIMYLQAGPKVTTISMVQADDEKAIQRLMTGAIALLERWPVFEIEMVAREDFDAICLDNMRARIRQSYKDWYTPEKLGEYLKRSGYELYE